MESSLQILIGLRNRDSDVEQRFWNDRWPEVYAVCRHILGNNVDAADAAVDVITDFMTKYVHTLTNPLSINAYLRLMATRRSLKYKKQRERFVYVDPDTNESSVDMLSTEDKAQFTLLMPRLNECIGRMTDKAQQAIRLRYGKQMTTDRIGALIGASKQYIGRLLKQSIEFLKRCLETGQSREQTTGKADSE